MLFINQEERRASGTVLSTSENNDIANQSVVTSFFTSEKNRMTNPLASLFYLDAFWRVNLGMYIIKAITRRIRKPLACGSWFTNSSRVLPTSQVVYQPITHRKLVVYCFYITSSNQRL